jgi:hypothetical protein
MALSYFDRILSLTNLSFISFNFLMIRFISLTNTRFPTMQAGNFCKSFSDCLNELARSKLRGIRKSKERSKLRGIYPERLKGISA